MAIDLGLIVSNNGIHFREPLPDHKVIASGAEGEWDSIALLQGHAFVNVGDGMRGSLRSLLLSCKNNQLGEN